MTTFTKHNKLELPSVGLKNYDAITAENFGSIEKGATMKAVAGLTVLQSEVAYLDTNHQWGKAIAGGTAIEGRWLGFVSKNTKQNAEGYVRYSGYQKNEAWNFTPGAVYLSSTTAGAVTQVEPGESLVVGFAIGTNEVLIKPWSIPPDLDVGTSVSGEGHISWFPVNYDSILQGTWGFHLHVSQNYIMRYRNSSNAINDGIRFKMFLDVGTYTWEILHTRGADRGIAELLIDDVSEASIDLYNAITGYNILQSVSGIAVTTAGLKNVDLIMSSKNASSSGYIMYISTCALWRTA